MLRASVVPFSSLPKGPIMSAFSSRRSFLSNVGRATLLASLGPIAFDMSLVPATFGEERKADDRITFGDFEPLVCQLQDTPVEQLQPLLVEKLNQGLPLKTLVGAAALGNARTFGGEDYIGFHTFMALIPAYRMSSLLPSRSAALPVLKVAYRNTKRIHEFGGRQSEVLHPITVAGSEDRAGAEQLHQLVQQRNAQQAEELFSRLVARDRVAAMNALIPLVQDSPEVHRTVLPYRAWDMQEVVGTEHALTLLRQSLRYCLQAEAYRNEQWKEHGTMLAGLFDEFHLQDKPFGTRQADDDFVRQLSQHFAEASAADAARAAASALAEGFDPRAIGEAMSLAASRLVLRDGGRLPQWETPLKPAGCVHGDSVGVHASDSANAWRNMSRVTTGTTAASCLIMGAWQVARDRVVVPNLFKTPLPSDRHLNETTAKDPETLLAQLDEAIKFNQQAHAAAIAQKYGELSLPADRIFATLLKYAVSEDGALHAEKYFQTVHDDFHSTRPSLRWQHVAGLARVTASEYGRPAEGQQQARELLRVDS